MAPHAVDGIIGRLFEAVRHLAVAEGDVRKRLIGVGLELAPILEKEVPAELRDDFRWVMAALTRYTDNPNVPEQYRRGAIEVTMKRIRNATGTKIATRVFDMFVRAQSLRGREML